MIIVANLVYCIGCDRSFTFYSKFHNWIIKISGEESFKTVSSISRFIYPRIQMPSFKNAFCVPNLNTLSLLVSAKIE